MSTDPKLLELHVKCPCGRGEIAPGHGRCAECVKEGHELPDAPLLVNVGLRGVLIFPSIAQTPAMDARRLLTFLEQVARQEGPKFGGARLAWAKASIRDGGRLHFANLTEDDFLNPIAPEGDGS